MIFQKDGNSITTCTSNLGIAIQNVTTVLDGTQEIYAVLTGDQCALTNIRISKQE